MATDNPVLAGIYRWLAARPKLVTVLALAFVLLIIFETVTRIYPAMRRLISPETMSNYVSVIPVDAFYFSLSSLKKSIPDVVGPSGMVPTDNESQVNLFRLYALRGRPVIKFVVSNKAPNTAARIRSIELNVSGQQYWWRLEPSLFQPAFVGPLTCPANSDINVTAVPSHLPYEANSEIREAFEIFNAFREPLELWAKIRVTLHDGSTVTSSDILRIRKDRVRPYGPDASF